MEALDNSSVLVNVSEDTSGSVQCILLTKLILHSVLGGSVAVMGFAGNLVSFLVLRHDSGSPVASFMLQALAATDNFFLAFWWLHFSLSDLMAWCGWRPHVCWLYIRLYTYPLLFVGQTATIWMTVLIAVSRYVAVCQPYKAVRICTKQAVKRGVIAVSTGAILYNFPRFFETAIIVRTDENGTSHHEFVRTMLGDSSFYKLVYFDISYYIVCFVLPLIILAILNTRLTISYRRVLQRKRRMSLRRNSEHAQCDHNITLVLIIVILVFMACNCPARIVQIVWRYKPQDCLSTPFLLMEISNVLELLNSSVNFIIYCVFRKKFRRILQQTVHCLAVDLPQRYSSARRSLGPADQPRKSNNKTSPPSPATL